MDIKTKIEEILLIDYGYADCYTVDKLLDLFVGTYRSDILCNHEWIKHIQHPKIGAMICRKCFNILT